jgi:hypothetical protein
MAEPVGTRPGGGDGGGPSDPWPSRPTTPPQTGGYDLGGAPTDPEIPRTPDGPPPPTTEGPFFHDLSGGAGPFDTAPGSGAPVPATSPYGPQGYPPPPYGYGYGANPYGPYAYGGWSPPSNNGLAVASMVCGILAFVFCQVLAIPGLILGLRARRQIRESQGAETGDVFALAGIILSAIGLVLLVAVVVIYALFIGVAVSGV